MAARAASYTPGDTVTFRQRSKRHGIMPGTRHTIDQVGQHQVHLLDPKGKAVIWTPARRGGDQAEVYTEAPQEFRVGDRLQFTRNNYAARRLNGAMVAVAAIDPACAAITVTLDDGSEQSLDLRCLADRHVRSGWVRTIHSAQGATSDRVMADMESFRANTVDARSTYVAISRAREGATLYTDNRSRLTEALGIRNGAPVGAIDEDMGAIRPKGASIAIGM